MNRAMGACVPAESGVQGPWCDSCVVTQADSKQQHNAQNRSQNQLASRKELLLLSLNEWLCSKQLNYIKILGIGRHCIMQIPYAGSFMDGGIALLQGPDGACTSTARHLSLQC